MARPVEIDEAKALALKAEGKGTVEIAKEMGVNRTSLWRVFQRRKDDVAKLEAFRDGHGDVLKMLQSKSADIRLKALDEMENRGMSDLTNHELRALVQTLAVGMGVDFDKTRFLNDQSTTNIYSLRAQVIKQINEAEGIPGSAASRGGDAA